MSNEKRPFTLFRAAWTAVKAGAVVVVLGFAVLAINHAEVARHDSSEAGVAGTAAAAHANAPAEAVYLPTHR